jgi:hypothetical protein
MILEAKVPEIGESITEVTLSAWLISDGDYVEIDQSICEFESDKATLEFPAEQAGKHPLLPLPQQPKQLLRLLLKSLLHPHLHRPNPSLLLHLQPLLHRATVRLPPDMHRAMPPPPRPSCCVKTASTVPALQAPARTAESPKRMY